MLCGVTVLSTGIAFAETPWNFKFSGFIEGYYGYNFNKPNSSLTFPRQFDFKDNLARINNGTLNTEFGFSGFKIYSTFWVGDNADTFYDGDMAKEQWARNFRQLYVSYTTKSRIPITIDLGKFDTWMGYEVTDSTNNANSSRGVLYTLGVPSFHSGIRATAKLTEKVDLGVAIVQGWNESANGDDENSYGVWLKSTLDEKTTATLSFYGGKEGHDSETNPLGTFGGIGFGNAGLTKLNLINFNGSRTMSDKLTVGWDTVYAQATDGPNAGKWSGLALFGSMTMDAKRSIGMRFEWFDDKDGVRTGTAAKIGSLTGTFNYQISEGFRLRAELRRDWSNEQLFASDSGNRKNQMTGLISAEFKF